MRTITNAPTLDAARVALKQAMAALQGRYPKVAELLDEHGEEMLAVYQLPEPHRKRMRSTNMLERYNQELKRRTRVVRIFPDDRSCLRLVTALAIEQSEEWQERRYLDMDADEAADPEKDAAGRACALRSGLVREPRSPARARRRRGQKSAEDGDANLQNFRDVTRKRTSASLSAAAR